MTPENSRDFMIRMSAIACGGLTEQESLQKMSDLILKEFSVKAVTILSFDSASRSATVFASSCAEKDYAIVPVDIKLKVDFDSILQRILTSPTGVETLKAGTSDTVLGPQEDYDVLVVPMALGDDVAGFLLLAVGKEGLFEWIRELLLPVAGQAATVVGKAQLKEELLRSEERYEIFMENAGDLVFLLDRGGRFLYVNPRSRDILGYEPEDMEGRYFGEFVTAQSWADAVAELKRAISQKRSIIEYSWNIQRSDGEYINLQVRASLIYKGYELVRHQGIARDMSFEKTLKKEIERRDEELNLSKTREDVMRAYLSVATKAQEEERRRIARDIHDGPLQYLVAIRRRLDLLRNSLDDRAWESIDDLDGLLDIATGDLREFSRNLRPPVLDDFGLVSACEFLRDETEKEGISVSLKVTGDFRRLEPDVEISLFRIVQEGLSNAVKHARASSIFLELIFKREVLNILIADNGEGFDANVSSSSLVRAGQMGLVGMFERAQLIGATIDLVSAPGEGTSLSVSLPLGPIA